VTRKPLLITERLELWAPQVGDLAEMHGLSDDPETRRYLGPDSEDPADSFARLLRNAGSWELYGYGNVMLRLRGQRRIIGNCGVFHSYRGFGRGMDDVPEAGWLVERPLWGQGLASEAMRAILAWFDRTHDATRITCMIEQGNRASEALAHMLGFRAYDAHRSDDADDDAVLVLYERLNI
jgi:RimJ/RimL family protein N-acetyltransferase